ncbi:MAG TPA: winged helix-turn-helix domain-containing protein, partial [Gemmataceae bacterium]|nr:winged helix-turn-helix domain-containing protein [Gemmataceae bacterium]
MAAEPEFVFGAFRLDPANARLTRGRLPVPLKPKAFDVLAHLVRRAGRLVTQEELIEAVWPDTIVGDSSLKSC